MYKITYKSGRISFGIFASDEQGAIRAARWLYPKEQIEAVEKE